MAARADLADVRLADRVFAPHYAAPMCRQVATKVALLAEPNGPELADLHAGDRFEVLELTTTTAWGVAPDTGLVGYLPLAAIGPA